MNQLYGMEAAEQFLSAPPGTMRAYILTGKLRAIQIDGRVFVYREEVHQLADQLDPRPAASSPSTHQQDTATCQAAEGGPASVQVAKSSDLDPLEVAQNILSERCPSLSLSTIEKLAEQAFAKPIEPSLNEQQLKRELGKRITKLIRAQFPHLMPKRHGRGLLITVGPVLLRGAKRAGDDHSAEADPESSTNSTDGKLSALAFKNRTLPVDYGFNLQEEDRREERQHAAHRVAQQAEQLSPANARALQKILDVVEPGDSYATLARKSGLFPMQVKRLFDAMRLTAVRDAHHTLPARIKGPAECHPYNPRTVSMADIMRTHDGAVQSLIGYDQRTHPSGNGGVGGKAPHSSPKTISDLARPRHAVRIEHPQFGTGVILKDREDKLDVEFDQSGPDGQRHRTRRTMMREFLRF